MAYFNVYPNMYIVLVSPPGVCKKSTAMRVGRRLLATVPGMKFSVDSTSRERLILDLSQTLVDGHSSMTANSSEFGSLFSTSGMEMVIFLTDVYDSPDKWEHRSKGGGIQEITAPCLNLVGCTTPEGIIKSVPIDSTGIGLSSRVLFVFSTTPRAKPWRPKLSDAQKEMHKLLSADLEKMSALAGEYVFDEHADYEFGNWYEHERLNESSGADPRLAGYFSRKPIHVIKVAMCLAASRRDELVITEKDYFLAQSLLASIEADMPKVYASVGRNPLAYEYVEVLGALLNQPEGVEFGEIIGRFKHNVRKDELAEVLDTLIEEGKVVLRNGRFYATN
jgi:hypothetical protein